MDLDILHDKIFVFKKAIPNAKEMYDHFKDISNSAVSEWEDWRDDYGNKDYGKTKSFYQKYWSNEYCDEQSLSYLNNFIEILEQSTRIYAEKNNVKTERRKEKNFAMSSYNEKGSELPMHIDTPDNYIGEEHSILIYWNEDYEGGELYFENYPEIIKPNSGDIIIFSSTDKDLNHGTKPVTKGIKVFTLQMWVDGPGKGYIPLCTCEECLKRPGRCGKDRSLYLN